MKRLKTIEYVFPTQRQVCANNTRLDLTAITLYIPETTGRVFRSFMVEMYCQDVITATGGTLSSKTIGLKLGAAAFQNYVDAGADTNSGENASWPFLYDFTAYANTNFGTGSSQTCQVGFQINQSTGTTLGLNNVSVRLIITYEYEEDAHNRQIKTVRIPLESHNNAISGIATPYLNQVPPLTGWLPESGIQFRNIWFTFEGNQGNTMSAATGNFALAMYLSGETPHTGGYNQCALNSSIFHRYIWDRTTDFPTGLSRPTTLYLYVTGTGTQSIGTTVPQYFHNIAPTLNVTYEFDHSGSNRIMNSLLMPVVIPSAVGGTTQDLSSIFARQYNFQESGIELAQSAVKMYYNTSVTISNLFARAGNQTYRQYTHNAGSLTCGGFCFQHRIDSSGGAGITGIDLRRGLDKTDFRFEIYRTSATTQGSNWNGLLNLNYVSNRHPNGVGAHNHTIMWFMYPRSGAAAVEFTIPTGSGGVPTCPVIPEEYHWNMAIGYEIQYLNNAGSMTPLLLTAENLTGEYPNTGYRDIFSDACATDSEMGLNRVFIRARDEFEKYGSDPDQKLLTLERPRRYRFSALNQTSTQIGMLGYLTYHTINYPFSGNLIGYTGDGSNILVDIYRSDNDCLILQKRTNAGGYFTGVWYDNEVPIYCSARQDSTHVGRSDEGVVG